MEYHLSNQLCKLGLTTLHGNRRAAANKKE